MPKRFCKYVWDVECVEASSNGTIRFVPMEAATDDDIKKIFVENETLHIEQ